MALSLPQIDPVLIHAGSFEFRWYTLAYVIGIFTCCGTAIELAKRPPYFFDHRLIEDFVVFFALGVVLGGRLGYVLIHLPDYYWSHPLEIIQIWKGGMAFHGGVVGVLVATSAFAHHRKLPLLPLLDSLLIAAPLGIFLGKIGNFINGELWGRASDLPWAIVFPNAGPLPRHPLQFYEATLEGLCLFMILSWCAWMGARSRPGFITGLFVAGYGIARSVTDLFRDSADFLDFTGGSLTISQLLSAPMIATGILLIVRAQRLSTDNVNANAHASAKASPLPRD